MDGNAGESIGLKLTKAERDLLLTGLVYLPVDVEGAIKSTPPSRRVMISRLDLESLVGHVALEANHTQDQKVAAVCDGLFCKIENLLAPRRYW